MHTALAKQSSHASVCSVLTTMAYASFNNTPPAYDEDPSTGLEPIPLHEEKVNLYHHRHHHRPM